MMWGGCGQGEKTGMSIMALDSDLQHPLWHVSEA